MSLEAAVKELQSNPVTRDTLRNRAMDYHLDHDMLGRGFERYIKEVVGTHGKLIEPPHPFFIGWIRNRGKTHWYSNPQVDPRLVFTQNNKGGELVLSLQGGREREIDFLAEFPEAYVLGEAKTSFSFRKDKHKKIGRVFEDDEVYHFLDQHLPRDRPFYRWIILNDYASDQLDSRAKKNPQLSDRMEAFIDAGHRIITVPVSDATIQEPGDNSWQELVHGTEELHGQLTGIEA